MPLDSHAVFGHKTWSLLICAFQCSSRDFCTICKRLSNVCHSRVRNQARSNWWDVDEISKKKALNNVKRTEIASFLCICSDITRWTSWSNKPSRKDLQWKGYMYVTKHCFGCECTAVRNSKISRYPFLALAHIDSIPDNSEVRKERAWRTFVLNFCSYWKVSSLDRSNELR